MDRPSPARRYDSPVPRRNGLRVRSFVAATAIVSIAVATAPVLQRLPHANLSLLFMTSVLIVAVRYGLWPSIYASILSFLLYNFFFTLPYLTLKVSEEGDVATLVFFLLMASLTANLAARMRDAMTKQENAMRRTAELQTLTRQVAGAATREEIVRILVNQLAGHYSVVVAALLPGTAGDDVTISSAGDTTWPGTAAAGPIAGWTRLSVDTARGPDGVIAVEMPQMTAEERSFAEAMIDQAAVALERARLVTDLEDARLVSEHERMRAALLSSVSHDLRTPLSSIIGAASSLTTYRESLSSADQSALLHSVVEEAERLDRHIQNLLDMTRLGHGELRLERDWEDIRDLLSAAARRLRLVQHGVRLETDIDPAAAIIRVHGDLIEQVFVNLFDNALRHAPGLSVIAVRAVVDGDTIVIDVSDDGPGIPPAERERIFEPFYRLRQGDSRSGAGLGLSICSGIVRAHGGDITAHEPPRGGTRMRIRLPRARRNPAEIEHDAT